MSPRPYPRRVTERRSSEVQLLYGIARWRLDRHVHLRRHGLREPPRSHSNSKRRLNNDFCVRRRRQCHAKNDRRHKYNIRLGLCKPPHCARLRWSDHDLWLRLGRKSCVSDEYYDDVHLSLKIFAVGTRVTSRPPPRSVRAAFPHTAPTSGQTATACRMQASACDTLTRLRVRRVPCQPHSPWSPPLAPPTPQQIAPLCSPASQLLWQSPTSRARASSATAPSLPEADRRPNQLTARREISQVPTRSICA